MLFEGLFVVICLFVCFQSWSAWDSLTYTGAGIAVDTAVVVVVVVDVTNDVWQTAGTVEVLVTLTSSPGTVTYHGDQFGLSRGVAGILCRSGGGLEFAHLDCLGLHVKSAGLFYDVARKERD